MSQGTEPLDDLLSGTDEYQAPPSHESAPERHETQPDPQTGVNQQDVAPPANVEEVEPQNGYVPVKVAQDERRKRQELEKKLKEYEERLNQPQHPQQQQQPPDWYTSPEQAAQVLQETMQQQLFQRSVAMSEALMRQQHPDYDEISTVFADRARNDPHLLQQLYNHPFPAQFAYQVGQQIRLMEEIGSDPAAYRAKIEAEVRAKLGVVDGDPAQPSGRPSQAQPQPSAVPRSLARDVSQQPRNTRGQFQGPAPIEDLLA
jgi:hypothetical protein